MCRSNKLVDELLESEPSRGSINRRSIGVLQFIDGGPQGNFIVAAELVDNGENFLRLRAKVNNALDILDYRALQGANDLRVKIYAGAMSHVPVTDCGCTAVSDPATRANDTEGEEPGIKLSKSALSWPLGNC